MFQKKAGTAEFGDEQHRVALGMGAAALTATSIVILALVANPAWMPSLPTAVQRLVWTLKAEAIVLLWLPVAVGNVARIRFFSAEDIGGSSAPGNGSGQLRNAVAILHNTLEQVVIAIFAHLILSVYLTGSMLLIPVLIGLFGIGRLLFWIGYAKGAAARAFGFALTFYPNLAACIAAITLLAISGS